MTFFGKLVMGCFFLVVGTGVFYWVTSYVKDDGKEVVNSEVVTPVAPIEASIPENSSTTMSASTTEASGRKMSFSQFMSKGGSYKCDVTQTMATMTSRGTVYMHDVLVRLEVALALSGQSMNTTMIARDGYMYSWTSATPSKGYKTKIAPPEGTSSSSKTFTWDGGQISDYTCEEWKADDGIFELPKSVVFSTQ